MAVCAPAYAQKGKQKNKAKNKSVIVSMPTYLTATVVVMAEVDNQVLITSEANAVLSDADQYFSKNKHCSAFLHKKDANSKLTTLDHLIGQGQIAEMEGYFIKVIFKQDSCNTEGLQLDSGVTLM